VGKIPIGSGASVGNICTGRDQGESPFSNPWLPENGMPDMRYAAKALRSRFAPELV
jgi:hypothetical protein